MSALEISTEKESLAEEPQAAEIPDKLYFPIREAARIIGVEPYVLRFWEKEFPMFHPGKGGSGHRRYRKKDLEMALEIKRLLYREGFTIEGARNRLKTGQTSTAARKERARTQAPLPFMDAPRSALNRIRRELSEILTILDKS
ncbi:MAG: MerR family transcriptional regulator [Acidobacteria bacterium]|nr:MerR family transcriptional regulator [Acidobacteriota bacterium]